MYSHSGIRPYVCHVCGMRFKQSGHLSSHKRKHSGEKSFVCEECDRKFIHKSSLIQHIKTHIRKPLSTSIMDIKSAETVSILFSLKLRNVISIPFHPTQNIAEQLKNDEKRKVTDKKFHCLECGGKFARKQYFVVHQRKHTGF